MPYIFVIGYPAFFSMFWLLAVKYSRTAYEIPFIVSGQSVPIRRTFFTRTWTDRIMLAANIIVSSITAYFSAYTFLNPKDTLSPFFLECYFISVLISSILVIISAVLLIHAVFKIKKELNGMEGELNVRQLILHASAFILFAAGFLVQRVTIVVECIQPGHCVNG
jgi:hypothetical protein